MFQMCVSPNDISYENLPSVGGTQSFQLSIHILTATDKSWNLDGLGVHGRVVPIENGFRPGRCIQNSLDWSHGFQNLPE